MNNKLNLLLKTSLITLFLTMMASPAFADDDDHDDDHDGRSIYKKVKGWFSEDDRSSKYAYRRYMKPVNNPLYTEECGSCHWVFLPELLPAASWEKMMNNLENHFSEDAAVDAETKAQLTQYLTANSADKSGAKRAVKMMRSLSRGDVPEGVTKIPYIIHKHRELSSSIYKRDKIRSLANCTACHTTADNGVFSDDDVSIPR